MKVNEGQGMALYETMKKRSHESGTDGDFQLMLDQATQEKDGKGSTAVQGAPEPIPPGGIQILGPVQETGSLSVSSQRNQILENLEQTLDLMDFYASRLADRSLSVRDLDSLVGHLQERVEDLQKMESTPGLPVNLKSLLSETAMSVGTEVAKFRRGDYV